MNKNLFDYATKELSQDAFLRWFIENDYEDSGRKLLSFFTGVDYEQINDIRTWAQSGHIDISIYFNVGNEPHALIIEDKVNTDEHSNQLVRYMKIVQKWNNRRKETRNRKSHFIFYKTRILSESYKNRIESASIENKSYKWMVFDLLKINEFFEQYIDSKNLIIKQYAEYVNKLKEDSTNVDLPLENRILAWKSFFEKTVKPRFEGTDLDIYIGEAYYGYAYLQLSPSGSDKSKTPYLEIRSRDCLSESLAGRILLYSVNISDNDLNKLKEKIRKFSKYFKCEDFSKQIACTKESGENPIKCLGQEDFINKTIEIAKEYLFLLK